MNIYYNIIIMKTFRNLLVLMIIGLGILRFALNLTGSASAAAIGSDSLMEKINQERANRNIPKLVTSNKLVSASTVKNNDMFSRGYFDHIDPNGHYVWPIIENQGYKPYKSLGENLAIDFSTEDGVIRAWIDSPTHRENMLKTEFIDQGLTAAYGNFQERYTSLVTSLFGSLALATPKAEAPPPPQTKPAVQPAPLAPLPQPQTQTAPEISIEKAPDEPPSAAAKNEPAIQLTPQDPGRPPTPSEQPPMTISSPKNLNEEDLNIYETVRAIFLILVALLFSSTLAENLMRDGARSLWKSRGFPVMLLLLTATILTVGIY